MFIRAYIYIYQKSPTGGWKIYKLRRFCSSLLQPLFRSRNFNNHRLKQFSLSTLQEYRFNFRTIFLPTILPSSSIDENRNLCTIIQNSLRSVILCIHRLADHRPIDTLSLLFTWSGLRARIFSAIRITVPVTGKYRNEFPFNFSLPSSPFIQLYSFAIPAPLSLSLSYLLIATRRIAWANI